METFTEIKQSMFEGQTSETEKAIAARHSVMIIDDNEDIIEALTSLLQRHYKVISCLSYEEAKEKLKPEIKVVLLDIKMARKDGVEVFKLLKEERDDLRIVFHSAYPGSSQRAEEVEELSHSGYLTKGEYSGAELVSLIKEKLNEAGEARGSQSPKEPTKPDTQEKESE